MWKNPQILPVSKRFSKVYIWEYSPVPLPNAKHAWVLRGGDAEQGTVPGWAGGTAGMGWGRVGGCSPSPRPPQVLSHNLYTVLCIPHDPVALEEHFRDDDDGPVSSQGYMPYLNKYILDKVSPLAIPPPSPAPTCCVSGGDTTVPGLLPHPVAVPQLWRSRGWKKGAESWGALG